jgi:hypothetical protein
MDDGAHIFDQIFMIKHYIVFDGPVSHDLVNLTLRDSKVQEDANCLFRVSFEIFVHSNDGAFFDDLKFTR